MSKLCKDCACENVCGITHPTENKACEYYKPDAVTEIEKIKIKMVEKYKNNQYMDNYTIGVVHKIIDERIAELKGENSEYKVQD